MPESTDPNARRRALGTSALAFWRALQPLLLREAGRSLRPVDVDDALRRLDDLSTALRALRNAGMGER